MWRNRLPSFAMVTRHLAIMVGELKMKLSIQLHVGRQLPKGQKKHQKHDAA